MVCVILPPSMCRREGRGFGSCFFFFSSRRRHTRCSRDWSSDVCSSDLKLVERCAQLGVVLQRRLAALKQLPHVGDVRGRGLLAGIEFVEDKVTRSPFPRAAKLAEAFTEAAQDAGLVVWPNVGHADGVNGDLVMVAPPFIVTEQEIDEIVQRLTVALEATVSKVVSHQVERP